jgi:hypothetical protein
VRSQLFLRPTGGANNALPRAFAETPSAPTLPTTPATQKASSVDNCKGNTLGFGGRPCRPTARTILPVAGNDGDVGDVGVSVAGVVGNVGDVGVSVPGVRFTLNLV